MCVADGNCSYNGIMGTRKCPERSTNRHARNSESNGLSSGRMCHSQQTASTCLRTNCSTNTRAILIAATRFPNQETWRVRTLRQLIDTIGSVVLDRISGEIYATRRDDQRLTNWSFLSLTRCTWRRATATAPSAVGRQKRQLPAANMCLWYICDVHYWKTTAAAAAVSNLL